MSDEGLAAAQEKMRSGGESDAAIDVFSHYYRQVEAGATGIVAESDLTPLEHPQRLSDVHVDEAQAREALNSTAVIKLNGGLGTSMGMERAKTLLPVRGELTFLDVIARQVLAARRAHSVRLPLVLMNSFRTRDDSLAALNAYDELPVEGMALDFLQNREPKLLVDDLTPASWPDDPSLEWCPPGHGDLYTAMSGSGLLSQLLDQGYRFAFVSNGDNLGATADLQAVGWFADSGAPYAAEVCRRTTADRKGGHLAVRTRDGQLVLRDSAQTAPEDEEAFADITRHRFFHCNNLWLNLPALADNLKAKDGVLGLPLIRNTKNVDPGDSSSPEVIQIETAMGAAIEVFPGAQALEVDRSRFLPVKSTNDLLALRSDVYEMREHEAIRLVEGRSDAPYVDLDSQYYKLIADFDARFPAGPPSLIEAQSLEVEGDWTFEAGVVITGRRKITAEGAPGTISA